MRIAITGATGMIGGTILRFAMSHPEVESILTIGRRATGIEHRKVREVEHADMGWLDAVKEEFADIDVGFFCLGAYTGAVPDPLFKRITVDFAVEFGKVLHAGNPDAAYCLLSGEGADPKEKSRMSFARYKGMAENQLYRIGFARAHFFRPGYIYPVSPRKEPGLGYRVLRSAWPVMRLLYPNVGIASDDLARAMLDVGLHGDRGHGSSVLRNRDLRRIARTVRGG